MDLDPSALTTLLLLAFIASWLAVRVIRLFNGASRIGTWRVFLVLLSAIPILAVAAIGLSTKSQPPPSLYPYILGFLILPFAVNWAFGAFLRNGHGENSERPAASPTVPPSDFWMWISRAADLSAVIGLGVLAANYLMR